MTFRPPLSAVRFAVAVLICAAAILVGSGQAGAATFTVTNTADSGAGSLRQALADADAQAGVDHVELALGGAAPHVVTLLSQLRVDDPVVLDATTQPGFAGTPVVVLDGSMLAADQNCLRLVGGGSTVSGLIIRNCPRNGIRIDTAGGNTVTGCYIGTDGVSDQGNGSDGVVIIGVDDNVVGGTGAGQGNVISGNDGNGVRITAGGSGNRLEGNLIGTDATGSTAIGNGSGSGSGVSISDSPGNVVGGPTTAHRNVISGNQDGNGVVIGGGASVGNKVQGNYVGLDAGGTFALANGDGGIALNGATLTVIVDNVVSGNGPGNVGAAVRLQFGSDGNTVQGNVFGLTAAGDTAVGNFRGVLILESSGNLIGGPTAAARNVISGNDSSGVVIQGTGSAGNTVQGNYIGLDAGGTLARGNGGEGVNLSGLAGLPVADNDVIGNVISANAANGVNVHDGVTGGRIEGNRIGTNAAGSVARPNASNGIKVFDASGVTVGGSGVGQGNVVSGNDANGMLFDLASGLTVQGNLVGLAADGTSPLGNVQRGMRLIGGCHDNLIGGTAAGEGSSVAFNGSDGIAVESGGFNALRGNSLHDNGDLGIDLDAGNVSPNDGPFDADGGANDLQNFPQLTSAERLDGGVTVAGSLDSAQLTQFAVDFFASPTCDPSGHGEGAVYLGTRSITTNSSGVATFNVTVGTVSLGWYVTATATDPDGNTSELSACRQVICGVACIFGDAFESGNTSAWSSSVP